MKNAAYIYRRLKVAHHCPDRLPLRHRLESVLAYDAQAIGVGYGTAQMRQLTVTLPATREINGVDNSVRQGALSSLAVLPRISCVLYSLLNSLIRSSTGISRSFDCDVLLLQFVDCQAQDGIIYNVLLQLPMIVHFAVNIVAKIVQNNVHNSAYCTEPMSYA